jgi:hypothetical protein
MSENKYTFSYSLFAILHSSFHALKLHNRARDTALNPTDRRVRVVSCPASCFGDYGLKCGAGYHDRFSYFPQLLQIGTRIIPEVRPQRRLSTAFQVHYSYRLMIRRLKSELFRALMNEP